MRERFFKIEEVTHEEVKRIVGEADKAKKRIAQDHLIPKKYLSEDRYAAALYDLAVLVDATETGTVAALSFLLKEHGWDEASELVLEAYEAAYDPEERRPHLRLVPNPEER